MATTSVPETPSQRISFCIKISNQTLDKKADGNWNLATAIQDDLPIDSYILFAKLKSHVHEAAVSPVLLCKWLEEHSVVRTVKIRNANRFREIPVVGVEQQCQHIFFLKTTDRRYLDAITVTPLTVYEGKDLCVVAFGGETLSEALLGDKRLTNVVRFELHRDTDRNPLVSLNEKACDYNNVVFVVSVKRTARKRTSSENSSGPLPIKTESMEEHPEEHDDDCVVVFPKFSVALTDSFSDEIAMYMIEQAQKIARSMLISEQSNNIVPTLAELVKFAKKTPTARPARIFIPLAGHIKSVGCLVCGTVQGTCFLVGKNVVMTSHHIVNMIEEARSNATDQNNINTHAAIYIYFDYLYAGQLTTLVPLEVDETESCGNPGLDYVFLWVKENDVLRDRAPLGLIVRNRIPESGIVTIIGHPDGGELLEDSCRIISSHQSNLSAELDSRAEKKAKNCAENPLSCSINNVFSNCVHMYVGRSLQHHTNQLAYDTTLFEGSSGSPVFNTDGHIVAMHTQGYPIDDKGGKKTSIMEFGVTFAAIFEDVKSKFGEKIAKYFPRVKE